jgi:Ca2+-binding EF-hand superfamily protein
MRQLAITMSYTVALLVSISAAAQAADGNADTNPAAKNAAAAKAPPADSNDYGVIFDRLDANHDGQLTADEIPAEKKGLFERLLRLAGKPADGKLSRDEFIAQLKTTDSGHSSDSASGNTGGSTKSSEKPAEKSNSNPTAGKPAGSGPLANRPLLDPERIFNRLDTKGTGKITLDDVPEQRRPLFKRVFAEAGKGNGGSLTKDEFVKAFKSLQAKIAAAGGPPGPLGAPPPVGADISQRLKRLLAMSKRSDGKLTKEDLPERLRDRFDKIDANHDGLIDEQELREWLSRVQQRLQAAQNK